PLVTQIPNALMRTMPTAMEMETRDLQSLRARLGATGMYQSGSSGAPSAWSERNGTSSADTARSGSAARASAVSSSSLMSKSSASNSRRSMSPRSPSASLRTPLTLLLRRAVARSGRHGWRRRRHRSVHRTCAELRVDVGHQQVIRLHLQQEPCELQHEVPHA